MVRGYGPMGQEKPGLLDSDGNIRDLSNHVNDITEHDHVDYWAQ